MLKRICEIKDWCKNRVYKKKLSCRSDFDLAVRSWWCICESKLSRVFGVLWGTHHCQCGLYSQLIQISDYSLADRNVVEWEQRSFNDEMINSQNWGKVRKNWAGISNRFSEKGDHQQGFLMFRYPEMSGRRVWTIWWQTMFVIPGIFGE